MTKIVLGKGLEALIPSRTPETDDDRKFKIVPLDAIAPNPLQPRRFFDEENLLELAESFKSNGIIQPLIVKKNGSGYTIIAGERRFRAARLSNMNDVPVIVLDDVSDNRMLELAMVENLQRENLNAMEVSEGYRMLIDKCDLTQKELADKVGKSRVSITNSLRLHSLPQSIKQMIRSGQVTEGHARALLACESESEMLVLAQRIISESLSVRQVEKAGTPARRKLIPKKKIQAIVDVESQLKALLGTSVKIKHGLKRGRIEVEYYGTDDLNRLLELFARIKS